MKKLALTVMLLQLVLAACKKDSVDPVAADDGATVVEGTYTINQATSNNVVVKFPSNGVTGKITFTRTAANQSSMRILILDVNGNTASDGTAAIYLAGSNSTSYVVDLYAEPSHTNKVGAATKNTVKLSVASNGTTSTFDASR